MKTTHEKLRSLLASARVELQQEADEYGTLLNQLELLKHSLDANEPSDEELKAAMRAFPGKLRPMRAGAPAGDGLKDTRKLWEALNHIVRSRQKEKS